MKQRSHSPALRGAEGETLSQKTESCIKWRLEKVRRAEREIFHLFSFRGAAGIESRSLAVDPMVLLKQLEFCGALWDSLLLGILFPRDSLPDIWAEIIFSFGGDEN